MLSVKENVVKTIKRNLPEWVPYRYNSIVCVRSDKISTRPPEGGVDDWGINWIPTTDLEGSVEDKKTAIDIDDVENYETPKTDWNEVVEDLRKRYHESAQNGKLVVGYNELTLFERARALLGTEQLLKATVKHPEKLDILLDKITNYEKEHTQAITDSGCEGVRFTDDWGMQHQLFIPPPKWREFIKPRLASLYNIVKEEGRFVFQHSDGCIEPIIPDLIEIGCDVLDPIQPQSNNIFQIKDEFCNRLSFMGGIDTQTYLSFSSEQKIKKSVTQVLEKMSQGAGYIAAPSHTISIPDDNKQAMIDAINEFNGREIIDSYF